MNYTWSHTTDDVSSTYNESTQTQNFSLRDSFRPSLDRDLSDFDAGYRIAVSAIRSVASAKKANGLFKQALNGWAAPPILINHANNPSTVFDIITADLSGLNVYFCVLIPDAWNAGSNQGRDADRRQGPKYQPVFVPRT